MAAGTQLSKSGLILTDQDGDYDWYLHLRNGQQAFEDRLGLSYAGDPNGNVAGSWFGQTCYDTTNQEMYFCVKTGAAIDAQWFSQGDDPNPPGQFATFMRADLPAGYLPCDGVVRTKADYPRLWAVLPSALKTVATFTLPNINERLALLIGGVGDIGSFVGSNSTSAAGAIPAVNGTTGVTNNPADSGEIGYVSDGYVNVPTGSGQNVMRYIARILAQTFSIPAIAAHSHPQATRGILLVAGVHF